MKHQIRRLPVHRNATVMAALGATATALVAVVMAMILPFARSDSSKGEILFWLLLMPFLYALVFYVFTAVTCAVYNLVAKRLGGFELELAPLSPVTGPEPAGAGPAGRSGVVSTLGSV